MCTPFHNIRLCRLIPARQTILESAWDYRDTNAGVYGIVPPLIRAWTSTETMVNTVVDLFNRSAKFVEEAEPEDTEVQTLSTVEVVKETKSQLPALAAVVFRCCSEREEWLERWVWRNFFLSWRGDGCNCPVLSPWTNRELKARKSASRNDSNSYVQLLFKRCVSAILLCRILHIV